MEFTNSCVDSTVEGEEALKCEDSKLYACFALQSEIFLSQVNELIKLNDVLVAHDKEIGDISTSLSLPDLFKKRDLGDGRKIDDFETLLLSKILCVCLPVFQVLVGLPGDFYRPFHVSDAGYQWQHLIDKQGGRFCYHNDQSSEG